MKRSAATGVSYRNIVYYMNPYVTMGHLILLASVTLVFTPKLVAIPKKLMEFDEQWMSINNTLYC